MVGAAQVAFQISACGGGREPLEHTCATTMIVPVKMEYRIWGTNTIREWKGKQMKTAKRHKSVLSHD
jgi:hypothetical protein